MQFAHSSKKRGTQLTELKSNQSRDDPLKKKVGKKLILQNQASV